MKCCKLITIFMFSILVSCSNDEFTDNSEYENIVKENFTIESYLQYLKKSSSNQVVELVSRYNYSELTEDYNISVGYIISDLNNKYIDTVSFKIDNILKDNHVMPIHLQEYSEHGEGFQITPYIRVFSFNNSYEVRGEYYLKGEVLKVYNGDIYMPVIESIEPKVFEMGDEILVRGSGFCVQDDDDATSSKFYLAGSEQVIDYVSDTLLKFKVNEKLINTSFDSRLESCEFDIVVADVLQYKEVIVEYSDPMEYQIYDDIEIIGENFVPDAYEAVGYGQEDYSNVYISQGDYKVSVEIDTDLSTKTKLVAKIPVLKYGLWDLEIVQFGASKIFKDYLQITTPSVRNIPDVNFSIGDTIKIELQDIKQFYSSSIGVHIGKSAQRVLSIADGVVEVLILGAWFDVEERNIEVSIYLDPNSQGVLGIVEPGYVSGRKLVYQKSFEFVPEHIKITDVGYKGDTNSDVLTYKVNHADATNVNYITQSIYSEQVSGEEIDYRKLNNLSNRWFDREEYFSWNLYNIYKVTGQKYLKVDAGVFGQDSIQVNMEKVNFDIKSSYIDYDYKADIIVGLVLKLNIDYSGASEIYIDGILTKYGSSSFKKDEYKDIKISFTDDEILALSDTMSVQVGVSEYISSSIEVDLTEAKRIVKLKE